MKIQDILNAQKAMDDANIPMENRRLEPPLTEKEKKLLKRLARRLGI